jgi:endo-1,4-beta-xylanase
MEKRTGIRHPYLSQSTQSFHPRWNCGPAFLLFIWMVALTMTHSFAQPLASDKSKFVGNIISNGYSIHSNFSSYWNQVTAENAGKWGSVEFSQGSYSWTQLDNIYNYALANGFPYKHHNLIWGQQQPGFMSSLDSASQYQEIVNWIDTTGQRYQRAGFCDVVNEPLHAQPVYKNALGGDGATGWDWVIKAFELARQYWSPNTKLLINEYNVLNDASGASRYIQIINLLKDRGLIDGIGIQAHSGEVDGPSLITLKTNLDKITATGVPVYISEFDINESNDNTQLQRYQSIFPLLYEDPGVYGITLWGYIQGEIWQTNAYLLTDRLAERPAMQWLRTYLASPFAPVLLSPVGTTNEPLNPILIWHPSDSATTYNAQISVNSSFSSTILDTTVTDTLLQLSLLKEGTEYFWRVSASNDKGTSLYSTVASFTTEQPTDVTKSGGIPADFALAQNYPNPFNPTTQIKYSVPEKDYVSLKVYSLVGQEVATLFNGVRQPGNYVATFDGTGLASGVYLYRLVARDFVETRKLLLLR